MNTLYKEILSNLMLIENEEDPLLKMIAYAKIGGIVEYAFAKGDTTEESAKKFMYAIEQAIKSCIDQLDL